MRITGWEVERFAGLRDLRHRLDTGSRGGLVLVYGPNEAGKSTLLRFINAMLFGGASGGSGSLHLEANGERYRVRRNFERSRGPALVISDGDGRDLMPEHLNAILGGVDARVYKAIFGFGLSELQELASLTAEGVQERIFSAGISGAGASARAAVSGLRSDGDLLLRPRAASIIGDAAREYASAQRALREQVAAAAAYPGLLQAESVLQAEIARLDEAIGQAEARARHLEVAGQVWPAWSARREASENIATYDGPREMPPVSEAEIERLCEAQRNAEAGATVLRSRATAQSGKVASLRAGVDQQLLEAGPKLDAVAADLAPQRGRQRDLQAAGAALAGAQAELASRLNRLGAGWDAARLESFDASLEVQAQARAFRDATANLEAKVASAESLLLQARDTLAEAQRGLAEAERRRPDETLLAAADAVRELHAGAALQRSRLADLGRKRLECERGAAELSGRLAQFGPGWDENRLRAFDSSLERTAEVRRLAEPIEGSVLARREGERDLATARARRDAASGALAALPEPQLPAGGEEAVLAAERAIARLRGRLPQLAAAQAQVGRGSAARLPAWAWILPLLPLALGGWLLYARSSAPAAAAMALALLSALALLAITHSLARQALPGSSAGQDAAVGSDLARLASDVRADLALLGLPAKADLGTIEEARLAVEARRRQLGAAAAAGERREAARAALANAERELATAESALRAALDADGRAHAAWRSWCQAAALPERLQPGEVSELLAGAEAARVQLAALDQARGEAARLAAAGRAWEDSANRLLAATGQAQATGEEAIARIEATRARLEAALADAAALRAATEASASATARLSAAEAAAGDARNRLDTARRNWQAWCRTRQVPEGFTPEDALALLAGVEAARLQARAVTEAGARLQGLEQASTAWQAAARSAIEDAGRAVPTENDLTGSIEGLAQKLKAARAQESEAEAAARALQAVRTDLEDAEAAVLAASNQLREALATAKTSDPAGLREAIASYQRYQQWQATVSQAESELRRHAGAQAAALATELERGDPLGWAEELRRTRQELQALAEQREAKREERTRKRLEREALEASGDVAGLNQQLAVKGEQLRAEMRRWIVTTLAGDLIADTLKEYERSKGPEVLRRASTTFRTITGGRYARVVSVDGKAALRVASDDDHFADASELSRGTQEQLYLAVRLGLARLHGERTAPLPLVMDDVLVNADPERADLMARALVEVAEEHQVLFLTCHDSFVERFLNLDPSANLVELPRLAPGLQARPAWSEPPERTPRPQGGASAIQALLEASGGWLLTSDIRRALAMSDAEFTSEINALYDAGLVERDGQRRGTKYRSARVAAAD